MSGLPGIIDAKASYRERNIIVQYDPTVVTPAEMAGAIESETYYTVGEPIAGGELGADGSGPVAGSRLVIQVDGMTDARTAILATQAVGEAAPAVALPGTAPAILDVVSDTAESTLTVTYNAEQVSPQELVDAVQQRTGFPVTLDSTSGVGGGGADYTPYVIIGIAGLFVAALAWPGVSWGRRRLARANAPSRSTRRRAGRRRR